LLLSASGLRAQSALDFTPSDGYARLSAVDVLHYDIRVAVPDEGAFIQGRTGILFEVRDPALRELPLDFGALTVDSVTVDGAPALFRHQDTRLAVALPELARGARAETVIWYHGEPRDGLILRANRHGHRAVFADNWPDRARHWFPGIDHPSDKASVDIRVDAPSAMEVVANGYPRERTELGGGRARTRWSTTEELPTYCMVFGAADFAVQRTDTVEGAEISNWVFPEDSAAAAEAFARAPEIVAFFDSLIGPFPFEKLAYVQSSTQFGGMENSSAIFYDEKSLAGLGGGATGSALATSASGAPRDTAAAVQDTTLTRLIAHETAHQWFGDAVTEGDWHHLWLSEGFATYLEVVFIEFHGIQQGAGPAQRARDMRAYAQKVFADERQAKRPIFDPSEKDLFALLNPGNYEKAAWVLHMLRREVGDRVFFAGLRDYYAAYRGGTAWTADFRRVMEEASGEDLGWFFRQWLERTGHPVLRVERTAAAGGRTQVRIRQVQPGPPYRFALDLELVWKGGSRRESVAVTGAETEAVFETPERVRSVVVDPDAWLLQETVGTR
jgi:aminopeptidase N